ncbi:aminotransferase class I/II-fold pyridoxal phosphate-dependent enzyme [Actinoallomurus sp. NBC_01490]|uniref:pyridoxal phosphate-dependent aminotransferase n=1 Tax=Actinoallomurus sp. NBC_01490 TaxID=2903557 RepID=UPI002E2ECD38|nr:aminotransferase class I/II-fold pyridoxal phosphate-dependent enzyme [Actinoallomurus sp. NBC_01490]
MSVPAATAATMPRSGIREVMDLAWATPDCIHLEVGEPSFPTPAHIVEAVAEAVRTGWTKYVPNAGIGELRTALAEKIAVHNGFTVSPDQVIVTSGGIGALFTAMLAAGEPGQGVLIPDPGWPNFAMIAQLHGLRAQPYHLRAEEGFLPTVEALAAAADAGTRVLILNSPSNPLGTITPADRLRDILRFAAERDLWVISDECYDAITFDDTWTSTAAVGEQDRVITVGTFSKTYAMTGMRVGYAVVPPVLSPVLAKLQEPTVACVNAAAQRGALAALRGPQDEVRRMRDAYRERRDALAALLDRLGVRYIRPAGAFYMWVEIADRADDAHTFAMELLRKRAVAVAPGTAFGASGEGWVRLSLATDLDTLLEGARRLADFTLG